MYVRTNIAGNIVIHDVSKTQMILCVLGTTYYSSLKSNCIAYYRVLTDKQVKRLVTGRPALGRRQFCLGARQFRCSIHRD